MDLVAPSLSLSLPIDPLDLPFSVVVERRMGHREAQELLRDLYNGTEFDLTKGVLAGPFGNPFRIEGGDITRFGQIPRGISISRAAYSVLGQPRRGKPPLMWYAADTPATSVFVPLYLPAGDAKGSAYSSGTADLFSRDSAWWAFDFVSNWMQLNFQNMSERHVFPLIRHLQDRIDQSLSVLEAGSPSAEDMAEFQIRVHTDVVSQWWKLADFLIMAYNDGMYNVNTLGQDIGYPAHFLQMISLDQDIHPVWVRRAPPPSRLGQHIGSPGLGILAYCLGTSVAPWSRVTSCFHLCHPHPLR